jgi:hypothetical protein
MKYRVEAIWWGCLKYILWHADPLLGNDSEINNYTTAVAKYCKAMTEW